MKMAGEGTPSDREPAGSSSDLERAVKFSSALFDYNPIETIVVDREGKVVQWNKAKENSGSRLPAVGDVMYVDYAGKHRIDMHAELMKCMETGEVRQFPDMPYGDEILSITIAPFPEGAIIARENMTERKLIEEEQGTRRRMEAVATLAGAIAHDFNNLFAGADGYAQLMERTNLSQDQARYLEVIRESLERATGLAGRVYRLAKTGIVRKRSIDAAEAADKALRTLEDNEAARNITVENMLEPEKSYVLADVVDIHYVLTELAKNSADAIDASGREGHIRVSAEQYTAKKHDATGLAEGEYFHIMFEDNGIGMPKEVRRRAFDPMFTTKEKEGGEKGKGLGLAIVYNVVTRDNDGHIALESKQGEGTTVHLYLPKAEPPEKKERQSRFAMQAVKGGSETILVIEDDTNLRKLAMQTLGDRGYQTLEAGDGVEGLEVYHANRGSIGAVLLDLTMPKMSGYEVLEKMLEADPDVKVIICSAHGEDELRKGILGRAKAIVRKPYELDDLGGTVREVLDSD